MLDKNHFNNWFNKNFMFNKNSKIAVIGKNSTYRAPEDIASEYLKVCATAALDTDWQVNDVLGIIESMKPKPKQAAVYFKHLPPVCNWIYSQLSSTKTLFDISNKFDMISFRASDSEVSTSDKAVLSWLNLRALDEGLAKVYKNGVIKDGWDLLKLQMAADSIKMLKESICYDSNYEQTMGDFIRSIYNYLDIKEDFEIFEMLFKHWCWTLKRHIWNKPVTWQIWINLYGAQGIGKTELIRRMTRFMRDFYAETNLNAFNDVEKQFKLFTDSYILYFDELNKGDNKDTAIEMLLNQNAVDSIKDLMTKDIITVRQYQTQDQGKFKNLFTPISAANSHLYDIVYDGEAMRRWFDFTCQRETVPESYDEINNILSTFQDALKGIDENNNDGYWDQHSTTGIKIKNIQKTYVPTNTSTNGWVSYCNITPDSSHTNIFNTKIYGMYKAYSKSVGRYSASMDKVKAILKRLWPEAVDADGNVYVNIGKVILEDGSEVVINKDNIIEESYFNILSDGSETTSDDVLFASNTETRVSEKTSPEFNYDDPKLSQKYAEAMAKQARNQFD